jgi:hypothetical protein
MTKVQIDKETVKHFLIHVIPVLIVWGGLGFDMSKASIALVVTNMLSATLDFVKDW